MQISAVFGSDLVYKLFTFRSKNPYDKLSHHKLQRWSSVRFGMVGFGWVGLGLGLGLFRSRLVLSVLPEYAAKTIYCRRFQNMAKCIGCKFSSDHLPVTIVFVRVRVQTVFEYRVTKFLARINLLFILFSKY